MNVVNQIFGKLKAEYTRTKSKKTQMIDALICYSVALGLVQLVYVCLVGNFPFNSFLSGFICQLSVFAFAVSLRLQLSTPSEFGNVSPEKALGDFVFCCLVLYFVVFSFLG